MRTFPSAAGRDNLPALQIEIVAAALHADLDDVFRFLFGLDEFHTLLRRLAQRLLDIDVFAGGERIQHHASVPVFRGGDQDRIDVFIVEKLFVIAVGARLAACFRGGRDGLFQVGFVDVADRRRHLTDGSFWNTDMTNVPRPPEPNQS